MLWTGAARSAGARLLILPVSALLGIVVTRLLIDDYGTAVFAQYSLLVAIGSLLPFTDLGMSAAVMNAVAGSPSPAGDRHVHRVLVASIRVLLASAAVLALVAMALTVAGVWPAVLGAGLLPGSGPAVAMTCLLLIAAGIPVGIGQRLLTGLGANHLSIAVLGMQTPLVLGVLLLGRWTGVDVGPWLAAVAFAATLLLSVGCVLMAARRLPDTLGPALRDVPRLRRVRGSRVSDVAWPMLVQMVALPLAMQTDRLVLSHRADAHVLAEYSLAAQMSTPIWAVVSAAGATLWPLFARHRAQGAVQSPVPVSWVFGAVAAVLATVVALASPLLARLASGGTVHLGALLVGAFAVLMTLQGLKYPLGMFLTDARGLRFQALMVVLMLPVNLGLSWVLVGPLGAAGPVVGSVVGVGLFQLLANHLFVRRVLRERAAAAGAAA